ncbi:MAG: hypothetical protein KY476_15445 [Planctomycetes bacterium]|nr:hypothetical protein [Planctomycetota bacterium]
MDDPREPRRFIRRTAWCAVLATILPGCGGTDGPERVAVDGEVTFGGRPVARGSILFIPIDDTRGPRAGAVVEDGRYRLPKDRGPVIGRLRVEIRAERELGYDITEPTESVKHIGEPLPQGEIPPRYNDRSTLVVETTADGENSFDFHLPAER